MYIRMLAQYWFCSYNKPYHKQMQYTTCEGRGYVRSDPIVVYSASSSVSFTRITEGALRSRAFST